MRAPQQLLVSRRFWPLFVAQFLGAFNDNFLKNAVVIMVTFKGLSLLGLDSKAMSTLGGALLTLPYIFFSAVAGRLADLSSKSHLMQRVKSAEMFIMGLAAVGFLFAQYEMLFLVILLLGLQATFFGPIKYSILPQLLKDEEMVAGNAFVEMGTNLAILLGTIAGGVLVTMGGDGPLWVSIGLIACAVVGYLATRALPDTPVEAPELKMDWNPFSTTWDIIREAARHRAIFNSILGISWFWLYGSAFIGLFLPYAKNTLHANESVVTFFLALFSLGVGVGSILCERLSFGRLELGLVPLGSLGMSWFAADLYLAYRPEVVQTALLTLTQFLQQPGAYRVVADLIGISIAAGFFIVPLYTFIQVRAEPSFRSRIVAANNIINSIFIVVWAAIQIWLLSFLEVETIFLVIAGLNVLVAVYIYTLIPEFFWRFVSYFLLHVIYRVQVRGLENIPKETAAVLTCNHVSFVDWLILYGSIPRPIRFVMDLGYSRIPFLRIFFRHVRVIPIAPKTADPAVLQEAYKRIEDELAAGEIVCIFPEGRVSLDGQLSPFKRGIEHIIKASPVPVVPMALRGLWGSFFSRFGGRPFARPFRRMLSRIELVIAPPIPPADVTAERLQQVILGLRGDRL